MFGQIQSLQMNENHRRPLRYKLQWVHRGQKHQRKEKQNRLMNASEATAKESIGYLLSDDETDEAPGSPSSPEAAQQPAGTSGNDLQGIPKQDAEEDKNTVLHVQPASLNTHQPGTGNSNERHALSALSSASSSLQMRLVSPFEEFPGPEDLPKQNNSGTSAENVTTDSQGKSPCAPWCRACRLPEETMCIAFYTLFLIYLAETLSLYLQQETVTDLP